MIFDVVNFSLSKYQFLKFFPILKQSLYIIQHAIRKYNFSLKMSTKDLNLIKEALKTKTLTSFGRAGGGCINEGTGYMTDSGPVFIKRNRKEKARLMFDGEYASLEALYATKTIRVPKPVAVWS